MMSPVPVARSGDHAAESGVVLGCRARTRLPLQNGIANHFKGLSYLRITPVTLYRYVGPKGQLREQGEKVLAL